MVKTLLLYDGKMSSAERIAKKLCYIIGNARVAEITEAPEDLSSYGGFCFVFNFYGSLTTGKTKNFLVANRELLTEKRIALVLTTGGTGFAPRDVTPEATASVCEKLCPGVGEAMRARALQITPRGMLSRGTAGIRGRTLIVNLPGSPRAALENLEPVFGPLLHGLKMLRQGLADCAALLPRQL